MNWLYIFCFTLLSATPSRICYSTGDGAAFNDLAEFTLWRQLYNKDYLGETNLTDKFFNWKINRDFIDQYNMKNDHMELELNKFADMHWVQWIHRKDYNNPNGCCGSRRTNRNFT